MVFSSWRDDPTAELIGEIQEAISPFLRAAFASCAGIGPAGRGDRGGEQSYRRDPAGDSRSVRGVLPLPVEGSGTGLSLTSSPPASTGLTSGRTSSISIREDAYFALGDLFKGRISNVYGNYFHLEHLTREAAREAIEKPIASLQ